MSICLKINEKKKDCNVFLLGCSRRINMGVFVGKALYFCGGGGGLLFFNPVGGCLL